MNRRGVLLIPFLVLGWVFFALLSGVVIGKNSFDNGLPTHHTQDVLPDATEYK